MSEDRLQFECVKWFWNHVTEERGFLCRTENKTTKGARDKALGLVKGMSDLKYTSKDGTQMFFELKAKNSRHQVSHLVEQLNFIEKHQKRGCIGFFIFSLEQFQTIMASCYNGVTSNTYTLSQHSIDYIKSRIEDAKLKESITVKLDYEFNI